MELTSGIISFKEIKSQDLIQLVSEDTNEGEKNFSVDKKYAKAKNGFYVNGGSCIIAPDGKFITQPVFDKEEIIIAEIDLRQITKEKMTLDVTGHYNRDDVFELKLKK